LLSRILSRNNLKNLSISFAAGRLASSSERIMSNVSIGTTAPRISFFSLFLIVGDALAAKSVGAGVGEPDGSVVGADDVEGKADGNAVG
jgi:hypothetical protein